MDTKEIIVEGISFIIPSLLFRNWPDGPLSSFPSCCGAGSGIGDIIVPETIFGVRITPACFIHDRSWEFSSRSWADFHQSNSMFLHNIMSIIDTQSHNKLIKAIRNYRAVTYYNAVDIVGADIFWNIKNNE